MISQFCDRNLSAVPMSEIRRAYDKLVHENNNSGNEKSSAAASNTVDKFIERRSDVELSLHSNKLVVVPVELFHLEHLVTLFLHRNQLATLPDELRLLRSLRQLSLNDNCFESVPMAVFELERLSSLYLSNNRLASLGRSEHVRRLAHSLQLLTAAHNRLVDLPDAIGELKLLAKLDVSFNRLVALPAALGDCAALADLNLAHNELRCLPPALGKLSPSIELHIDANPLLSPPPQFAKLKGKQIVGFLRDLLTASERVLVCKVLVVGQENVGKTTLVRSFRHAAGANATSKLSALTRKLAPKRDISTDGIDVVPIALDFHTDGNVIKGALRAQFYDFGGQEVYYTSHQFFVSARSLVLVVWDLSTPSTADRCLYWLKAIVARAGKRVPVMLVGTHADAKCCTPSYVEAEQKRVVELLGAYVDQIKSCHAVVASDASAVDLRALLVDIGANASRVPLVGAALPASYIALESVAAIAATRPDAHGHVVPVRSWKAWRQLGRVAGIERAAPDVERLVSVPSTPRRSVSVRQRSLSVAHRSSNVELLAATDDDTEVDESGKPLDDDVDDDALKRATTALHLLGSVVWFDDDVLCDLVILSTQWLSDAISTVLTTKHKLVKNGLMDAHSLPLIWKPPQFPERLHGRLVALLSQFELLHALSETRFLVPSMLPPQTPEDASMRMKVLAVPANDAAVRRYERRFALDFVPHGLFSRLLVRLLRFVPVVRFWDGGVLLSEAAEGNAGAVLLDGDAIRIVVVGRKVVSLLEDVVETFRALTDGWYSLDVVCTVPCAHCASARSGGGTVSEFALADLEAAVADGKSAVTCAASGESVSLELLVPDLLLAKRGSVDDVAQVNAADVVVGAEIARGGFGTVFEAKWRGMAVAAKQLKMRPHERVALFGDFRKEVRFMSRLRHPNIVALLGFCAEPPMLLLELLTGGDLYTFLHDSSRELDWRLRVRIWRDVARGLAYLHGTTPATLHLDLKSPNVLMVGADDDTDNVAKVSDFGTSVRAFGAVREDSARRTVSNPTWLAPEVLAGKPHAESSDVYALGVIGWELLTREHPFTHLNSSFVFELEDAIRAGKRPPMPASAPRRFVALVRAMWQPQASQRPTAERVAATLDAVGVGPLDDSPGWSDEAIGADSDDDSGAEATLLNNSIVPEYETARDGSVAALFLRKRVVDPPQALSCLTALQSCGQVWAGTVKGSVIVFDGHSMQQLAVRPSFASPIDALVEGAQSRVVWVLSRRRRMALAFATELSKPSPIVVASVEPIAVDAPAMKRSHRHPNRWARRYVGIGGGYFLFTKKRGTTTAPNLAAGSRSASSSGAAAESKSDRSSMAASSSSAVDDEDFAISLTTARVAAVSSDNVEQRHCIVLRSGSSNREFTFDFETEAARDHWLHLVRIAAARASGATNGLQVMIELRAGAVAGAVHGRELWLLLSDGSVTIYSGVHVDGAAKLVAQTTLLAAGETAALRGAMLATRSSMWVAAGSVIRTMRLDTHMVDNSLMGHAAPVVSLAHACGETVWSGDELGEIRAWSIADSTCVRKIRAAPTIAPPLSAVYALARVGAFVAAAIGSRVLLYSVTASTTAAQSEPALELASRHNEVAVVGVAPFQTDGMTFLVAGSSDESTVEWALNGRTGDPLCAVDAPAAPRLQRKPRQTMNLADDAIEKLTRFKMDQKH